MEPRFRDLGFPVAIWGASRLVVALALLAIAPALPALPGSAAPTAGWHLFALWDGGWYLRIATTGYAYAADQGQHSVAFFPLYPLLLRAGIGLGLRGDVAGVALSHLAFLGALCSAFVWTRARHGEAAARWACAVLAWFPLSLFCSLVYAEALFLLLSAQALRAFDQGRYGRAAAWGAGASATRVMGAVLAPAMAWAAWRGRLPLAAWAAALGASGGLLAFMAFGWSQWGDPLAFLHAQAGWRTGLGLDAAGWWALWRSPALWGEAIPKTALLLGGLALLGRSRAALGPLMTAYGVASLAVIGASGSPASVDRYAYAVLPLAIALGLWASRHPRWGGSAVAVMAVLLVSAALRFARSQWVA